MKIKLFVKYISLLVLLFVADGCKEKKADTYVTLSLIHILIAPPGSVIIVTVEIISTCYVAYL